MPVPGDFGRKASLRPAAHSINEQPIGQCCKQVAGCFSVARSESCPPGKHDPESVATVLNRNIPCDLLRPTLRRPTLRRGRQHGLELDVQPDLIGFDRTVAIEQRPALPGEPSIVQQPQWAPDRQWLGLRSQAG